jgi:ferredoxin
VKACREVVVKVSVDPVMCEANGVCVGILPDVFDLDDDEVLQVRPGELAEGEVESARRSVAACPRNALRLKE